MKSSLFFLLSLPILLCCCQQTTKTALQAKAETESILIDSTFRDTVKRHIQFTAGRDFSNFVTPIEARFFSGDLQTDSIIQDAFSMISWYSSHADTIDLVAHVGTLETQALLIRFIKGRPKVLFFRAPHEIKSSNNFKIAKTDTFTLKIEVAPVRYQLKLSEVPDTTNKQAVFGYIDLESGDYYDKRDTAQQALKVKMKFYFRSQYRKFNF